MEKGYILKKNDLLLSKLFRLRVDTVSEKKKKKKKKMILTPLKEYHFTRYLKLCHRLSFFWRSKITEPIKRHPNLIIYCHYFSENIRFDISCEPSTIRMKSQTYLKKKTERRLLLLRMVIFQCIYRKVLLQ